MIVRFVARFLFVLSVMVQGGCQDFGTAPVPHSVLFLSGNNQTGKAGGELAAPLVVSVLHQGFDPLPGVQVRFSVTAAPAGATGQALSETTVLTDKEGRASTRFTLGNKLGTYRVRAEVISQPDVSAVCNLEATEEDAPPIAEISFRNDVLPLFQRYGCLSCHGGTNNLFVGTVAQLLAGGTNGPAVTPGNADGSLIIRKTSPTPPFGDRMPLGGPYLPDSTLQVLRTWINQGTKDN